MSTRRALRDVLESWNAGAWGEPAEDPATAVSVLRSTNFRAGAKLSFANEALLRIDQSIVVRKRLVDGDVLLERSGGGPLQPVGRVALFQSPADRPYICGNFISRLVPDRSIIDPEYLAQQLLFWHLSGVTTKFQTATTGIRNLQIKEYLAHQISFPSVADQRRIAACLKTQLAAVEQARQAAQARACDIARLVSSILEAAFATTLDAPRIRLADLSRTTSGSTPSRDRKDYWEPAVYPWVRTAEVAFEPITATGESISERALHECSLSLLPVGTVLVAMYGQGKTRGQSAVLRVPATTNQACFAILPGELHDPQYLQFWLQHSYRALRELSDARGGNQSNLNGEILNGFEVPRVPLREQRDIAAKLERQLAAIEQMRAAAQAQLTDIEALPARLLAQAFDPDHFADVSKMVDERHGDHFEDVLDMVDDGGQ